MIIIFFIGLVIMASANQIGQIFNVSYICLCCNVIGGAMMCISATHFLENENKKRNEIKALTEKLVGKEEYTDGMNIFKGVEKKIQDNGLTLLELVKRQQEILDYLVNEAVNGKNIEELSKQIIGTQTQNTKEVSKSIENVLEEITKLSNTHLSDIKKINESCELLHTDLKDIRSGVEHFKAHNSEILNNIETELIDLVKMAVDVQEMINNIYNRIDNINMMPEMISESVENLIKIFRETISDIHTEFKHLEEDIEEQEKDRTKKFRTIMEEIQSSVEDSNEEMVEEIKKLAKQYEQFEQLISSIVEQMSHIAEEDIKVMKGFLNG